MAEPRLAERVITQLAVHIGPNVAKMSVAGFVRKAGLASSDQLGVEHLAALIEEIRPMLNVMIGRGPTASVLSEVERLR